MTEYKKQEIPVVVVAYTSVYPYAVMVELHHAHIAQRTVLRASRFSLFTGSAFFTLDIKKSIIRELLHCLFEIRLFNDAWVSPAS